MDKLELYPSTMGLSLIIMMESAESLLKLREICKECSYQMSRICGELSAIIFGSDDYCASIGKLHNRHMVKVWLLGRQPGC